MKKFILLLFVFLLMALPCFAAKQIIVTRTQSDGQNIIISVVFWFPITTTSDQLPCAACVSSWSGASAAETTALQNGTILEESQSVNFPQGTSTANIKAGLLQRWNNRNATITGPGRYNGVYYDGLTGWNQ